MEMAILSVAYFQIFFCLSTTSDLFADINLPLSGIALCLVWMFLNVRRPEGSVSEKLANVDWVYALSLGVDRQRANIHAAGTLS